MDVGLFLKRALLWFVVVFLVGTVWMLARPGRGQTVAQTLLFTWPGDDGNVGTCAGLDLRWSRNTIAGTDTLSWWNAATPFNGAQPVPKVAGTPDSIIVVGLPSDTQIYAVVRAFDEVPNFSGFSNVAQFRTPDFTPPGRVSDLRPRPGT